MSVDPDWTLEEAQAANEAAGGPDGPESPFFQWVALQELKRLHERFEAGDRYALMIALRRCANHDLVMPEWVSRAYIEAFDTVHNYRAETWDDVFGSVKPKGKHLAALRKKRMMAPAVYVRVHELHQSGAPICDELFKIVAREFGIAKKYASDWYYQWKKIIDGGSSTKPFRNR